MCGTWLSAYLAQLGQGRKLGQHPLISLLVASKDGGCELRALSPRRVLLLPSGKRLPMGVRPAL